MAHYIDKLKHFAVGVSASIILSACATPVTTEAVDDITQIMSWWSGDYNNDAQLAKLKASGMPIWRADDTGEGGHIEVTSHYRTVDLPAFGDNVIYVEETKHGDPDAMFRQRIYTLVQSGQEAPIRVKMYYFNDKEKYVGAYKDLSLLAQLTPDEMFELKDECDLIVEKQGDKYHMPMVEDACIFGERAFNYQVLLGKDSFWFRDKISDINGVKPTESAGNFTYHELDKLK